VITNPAHGGKMILDLYLAAEPGTPPRLEMEDLEKQMAQG
jgi:hypothetical protein